MTIADDLATSYQYVEGVEVVSLTPKNPTAAAVANIKSKRRVLGKQSIQQFGGVIGLQPSDITIHLWKSTMGATVPKQGDWITDAGNVVFTILALSFESLQNRWRCLCRQNV